MLPVTPSPLVASPLTAILTASMIAWMVSGDKGSALHTKCALACYSCNRSKVGSWTSYDPSPWVAGPQPTCCWGQGAWVSEWRMEQREAEWQSVLGPWQRWWGSWTSSSEG